MELPKYHEAFIPVLEILNTVDSLKSRELASKVRDNYYSDLSQELLNQKTSTGANVYLIGYFGQNHILKWQNLFLTQREEWFK